MVETTAHFGEGHAPGKKLDGNRMQSMQFAQLFVHAFMEASSEMQEVIKEMALIVEDESADPDDREAALITLMEAIFPTSHGGDLGIDITALRDEAPLEWSDGPFSEIDQADDQFARNLKRIMDQRGMTQAELAEKIGVGQPAISMMLLRQCHPQRRTVQRLAEALDVDPVDLLPGSSE